MSTATIKIENNFYDEFMIVFDKQVDSYMPSTSPYIQDAIVTIAKQAQQQNEPGMLYGALVKYALVAGETFDSLLMEKYIEAIITNENLIADMTSLKDVLGQVEIDTPYDKELIVDPAEYYLQNGTIQFESLNNNVATAEIQSGKIIFIPKTDGKTVIKMTDSANNVSLVNVEVLNSQVTASLVSAQLTASHAFIEGENHFRIVQKDGMSLALATTCDTVSSVTQHQSTLTQLNKVQTQLVDNQLQVDVKALETKIIEFTELGLIAAPTELNDDGIIGTIITSEFVVKTSDANATAVQMTSDGTKITDVYIVKATKTTQNVEIDESLNLSAINPSGVKELVELDAIHAQVLAGKVTFYASAEGKTQFQLTDVAGKTSVVNVEAKKDATGKINVAVEAITQALSTGSQRIVHISSDVVHADESTLIASKDGEAVVTLADGTQYKVTVNYDETNGYSMTAPEKLDTVVVTAQMVDLSKIDGPSGVSYASLIEGMLIISLPDGETEREIVVTNNDDPTEKAVVVVKKAADGTHTVDIVRHMFNPADLDLTTITSIEGTNSSSYRVVEKDGKAIVYGYGTTGGSYKVHGVANGVNATAIINITPTYVNNKYSLTATPATLQADAIYTFAADVDGQNIVRLKGNTIYALAEGYVELQLMDGSYYTFTVSKNATGHYVFSTPIILSRSSIKLEELGLTTITGVTTSDADVATAVANASNEIVITSGTTDATAVITVNGTYNGATVVTNIFVKREGNQLTYAIEKHSMPTIDPTVFDSEIDFAQYDHTTISLDKITWLSAGMVRPTADGTEVDFFVTGSGNTAAKVVSNVTTLVNFTADVGAKLAAAM